MSRRPLVPEAKPKLDKLKAKYSNEFGTELNNDYKGNKTSKLNGHNGGIVGGLMTKKMLEEFEKNLIDK